MPEPREKGVRDVSDLVVSALEELLQLVPVPPYSSSSLENSASEIGYENLRKPQIRDAIGERLKQFNMSAAEATERVAQYARGSLEPFLTADGHVDLSTEEAQYNLYCSRK